MKLDTPISNWRETDANDWFQTLVAMETEPDEPTARDARDVPVDPPSPASAPRLVLPPPPWPRIKETPRLDPCRPRARRFKAQLAQRGQNYQQLVHATTWLRNIE